MPGTDLISIYRGEDVELDFTMDPVADISGWTILFTVEGSVPTPKVLAKTATIEDGPNGVFRVALTDDDTDIDPGSYKYDAWRTDAGLERVLAIGKLVVNHTARFPE